MELARSSFTVHVLPDSTNENVSFVNKIRAIIRRASIDAMMYRYEVDKGPVHRCLCNLRVEICAFAGIHHRPPIQTGCTLIAAYFLLAGTLLVYVALLSLPLAAASLDARTATS